MQRLLLGPVLATMLLMGGTATATEHAECGAALSVHNAATCTSTTTLTLNGTPELTIAVAIGPAVGMFSGDVTAILVGQTSNAELHYNCVFRATNGLGALSQSCETHEAGTFTSGEALSCKGVASGVGEWAVSCRINPAV